MIRVLVVSGKIIFVILKFVRYVVKDNINKSVSVLESYVTTNLIFFY